MKNSRRDMKLEDKRKKKSVSIITVGDYPGLLGGISELLETARRASARTVNAFMTAVYWEIGRRIVEFEQRGKHRAAYGEELLKCLSGDLASRFGRGFGIVNLSYMKRFYIAFPPPRIIQTLSEKSPAVEKQETLSLESPCSEASGTTSFSYPRS